MDSGIATSTLTCWTTRRHHSPEASSKKRKTFQDVSHVQRDCTLIKSYVTMTAFIVPLMDTKRAAFHSELRHAKAPAPMERFLAARVNTEWQITPFAAKFYPTINTKLLKEYITVIHTLRKFRRLWFRQKGRYHLSLHL